MKVAVGDVGKVEWIVKEHMLASSVGSGAVEVFSTPFLVALAEAAGVEALKDKLEAGNTSVGTSITVNHLNATPLGDKVYAVATVVAIEGRKVSFTFEAFDSVEKIGDGKHDRFVLNAERFASKVASKTKKQ